MLNLRWRKSTLEGTSMSEDEGTGASVHDLILLGDLMQRNLNLLTIQHFNGNQSAMADSSQEAENAAVKNGQDPVGALKQSSLSRWSRGAALVGRLNQLDEQLRRLGLPGVTGHSLFQGLAGVTANSQQFEVLEMMRSVSPMRVQGVTRLLRLLFTDKPERDDIITEVDVFLRGLSSQGEMDRNMRELYDGLANLPADAQEREDLRAALNDIAARISAISQR